MLDHVYKTTEIAGSSTEGIDAAIRCGVAKAAETVRHLDWLEVGRIRGHIEDRRVAHVRISLKLGFRLEYLYANVRPLRLADGPDDVNKMTIPQRDAASAHDGLAAVASGSA